MKRLLVTSDWHGDWITSGVQRVGELNAIVLEMLERFERGGFDGFAFLGDLTNPYSRNVHRAVAVATSVAAWMNVNGFPNIWIVGNHDIVESAEPNHTLLPLANMGGETVVVDTPHQFWVDGQPFIGLPYTPATRSYSPEEFINEIELEQQPLVLGHLMIEGIGPGSETIDMPRGRDVFLPVDAIFRKWPGAAVFNGHYHTGQVFRGVHIPGSLMRLTHGEENNEPGWLEVNLATA